MGPPLYMRSVVDRNVVMRRIPVCENCTLLGYYAGYSGSSIPTFRHNLSGPHLQGSRNWILDPWKMGLIGCPKTSVNNCHCTLRNNPEERSSQGVV